MPRACCNLCHNPVVSCICKWTSPIFNKTAIVILQHPDEVKKPLGTAKIVSLCLQNSTVKVGVDFSGDADFIRLTRAPEHDVAILYPDDSALDLTAWSKESDHVDENNRSKTREITREKTLIVLDGTWRNTREILAVNPDLKAVRAVKLTPVAQSNYRIRKAPFADSLATVEAVSQALGILEPETPVDAMGLCFEKMVDYQISRMGKHVYRKNYLQASDQQD